MRRTADSRDVLPRAALLLASNEMVSLNLAFLNICISEMKEGRDVEYITLFPPNLLLEI